MIYRVYRYNSVSEQVTDLTASTWSEACNEADALQREDGRQRYVGEAVEEDDIPTEEDERPIIP